MPHNFAITGVGGYVAPRHLNAIKETGNQLLAAVDPNDSVGVLDRYFKDVSFFTEFERFDRHLEKLRRSATAERVDYVSICSPNYLHDAHCRFAMRIGADAMCEKPLVLNPWNIDALEELEQESGRRIWTILQLRVHPAIVALREKLRQEKAGSKKHEVVLTYITSRGRWYLVSWKGQAERSGGLATNIGIHFFDMLSWMLGPVEHSEVHVSTPHKAAGYLELENARVRWFLSIDRDDLPKDLPDTQTTFRSITLDGEEIEFSGGFTDLHTEVYRRTLDGQGFGLQEALPSISLAHKIRVAEPTGVNANSHPILIKR